MLLAILLLGSVSTILHAFSPQPLPSSTQRARLFLSPTLLGRDSRLNSQAPKDDDVCTVQILMSDTGGGHRASANALRDAFDVLHPGRIQVSNT